VCARTAGLQRLHGRSGDRALRLTGDQGAVPARHRQSGHLVVPGILRARGRFGPRRAAHHRYPRRRPLRDQRAEDLDHPGPVRRLDLPAGPHRSERAQEAGGHLVHPGRDEHPGDHRAPDQTDRRQLRGQRGLVRRRPGPGQPARRRGERRLELRQVSAVQRAHRDRAGRHHQGVADRGQGARGQDANRRQHADGGPAVRRPGRRGGERTARPGADPAACQPATRPAVHRTRRRRS